MKKRLKKSWYVTYNKEQYGPVSFDLLSGFLKTKKLTKEDLIWDTIKNEWVPIHHIDEFKTLNIPENSQKLLDEQFEIPKILKLDGTKIFFNKYRDGEKNRFYKRLKIYINVELNLDNEPDKIYSHAHVENISVGGLAIEGFDLEKFKITENAKIKIFLPNTNDYIVISGKIKRQSHIVNNQYSLAIQFTDISKEEGEKLLQLLENVSKFY